MPNNVNIAELRRLERVVSAYDDLPEFSYFIKRSDEIALQEAVMSAFPALITIAERAETAREDALREAAKAILNATDGVEYQHPIKARQQIADRVYALIKEPTDAA